MAFKDSMKIMINALSVKGGGGLTYLLELTKELAKICNSYKIYILVAKYNRKFFKVNLPREVTIIETPVSTLTVRLFYEQVILPLVISREKIDLLYCPAEILFCSMFKSLRNPKFESLL